MKSQKTCREKFEYIASKSLLFCCMLFFCILSYHSMRYSWLEEKGIPYDTKDSEVANLVILFCVTAVLFLIYHIKNRNNIGAKLEGIRKYLPYLAAGVSVLVYVISVLWVVNCHITPSGDGMTLCQAAHRMCLDNYIDMQEKGYLYIFPHQYGLLSLIRLIFETFGIMNYKVFQHINALCIPLLFIGGYKIIRLLYDKVGAILCYMLLFVACAPIYLYVPYVYGEIISITFTMVFMWQVIRFCKTGRKDSFLWGTIAIVIACLVRNNSLIVLIAVGIVLCITAVRESKISGIIWLLIMIVMVFGCKKIVNVCYEQESGIKISDGIPYISWVRMGMEEAWTGPGWFDNTSVEMFAANGYDTEKTIVAEKERFGKLIDEMWQNKAASLDFFKRKILSQWNSPGYRYLYETSHFDCYTDRLPVFVRKLYFDNQAKLQSYLNGYQWIVYFYTTVLTILLFAGKRRKHCLEDYLLYIAIFGGLLFTIIWEAGSRYVLPYFIYMLPLAAMGIRRGMEGLENLFVKVAEKIKKKRECTTSEHVK